MLKKNFRDNQKRILYKRFEEKAIILNSITRNRKLRAPIRWYCNIIFNKKQRKSSKVKIKNRCVLSGRSRSVYRFSKMSRVFLRDNDYIGKIPGLTKSYW